MGEYDKALADFDRAIELDETMDWAIASRGETHRRLGKYEEALTDFTKAIYEEEPDASILTRRAAINIALENQESARQDLERALSQECKTASAHYNRGTAFILSGRVPEGLAELDIAFSDLSTRTLALTDDLLDPLRNLPEFKAILEKYR
jgi:tetratricopeptide (TPR) repeat protein